MWQVQKVPPARYDEGLALVVGGGQWKSVSAGVRALRTYLDSIDVSQREFWWALDPWRVLAAALLIRSPGRTGIILNSPAAAHRLAGPALSDVLTTVVKECLGPRLILLQSLLSTNAHEDVRMYEQAGFWRLAELIYMRQNLWGMQKPSAANGDGVQFRSYSASTAADFVTAIQGSYQESLDCPRLEGLRTMDDVLAGHQASGLFRPDLWSVAYLEGKPCAVLLLNEIPSEQNVEIVYMGVAKGFRGHGLGRLMLARATQQAQAGSFSAVTLAVDSLNSYAMKLYQQAGFVETMRRLAYVRTVRD